MCGVCASASFPYQQAQYCEEDKSPIPKRQMSNLRNRFQVLVLFFSFVILTASQHDPLKSKQEHVAMFVFGDSIFDPGNSNFLNISATNGKANFPPYGETFFRYPTGRFCDGRIISDFTASFTGLPPWRPYLDPANHNLVVGANFAAAGACALVENNPHALNLPIQVRFFKEVVSLLTQQLGDTDTRKLVREAIYLSSLGGVDYMTLAISSSNITELAMQEYVNLVIGNITEAMKEIYEVGGRKFAFQNVGPLGCLPFMRARYNSTGECAEFPQILATMHNNALAKAAAGLEIKLSGFKYLIFDFFTSLMDRTNNPAKYGFKVGDNACCGGGAHHANACGWLTEEYELCSDPNEFVFWDGGHPTEHCYSQLAQLLWNGTGNVTWPRNMKQLYDLDIDTEEIYKLGGRKFAFQSVGPLGCVPKTKAEFNSTGECVEFLQILATMHNNALAKVAEELEIKLSGFKYLMFDFFTSLMDRANNHEKYGFKVGDNACCGGGAFHAQTACGWLTEEYELCSDPNKFVFWDALHPTEYCYSQLPQLLWNGTGNVTWPLNMKQLYDLDIDTEISSQDIDLISDA